MSTLAMLMTAFGASGALWAWQNRARMRDELRQRRMITELLDDAMQVALHLAQHAATSRDQMFGPAHLAYALARDEGVMAAIETLGGSVAEIENATEAALDTLGPGEPRAGNQVLGTALHIAGYRGSPHAGGAASRRLTCTDVFSVLLKQGAATAFERPPVTPHALLFRLVHGAAPPATLAGETHVHVILRNDDFTTQELVVTILREVFELDEASAVTIMRTTHESGRAVVGRFPVDVARSKIELARNHAREAGSPLWVGAEVS